MPVQEILLLGNPLLRLECQPVVSFNTRELKSTIQDLRDTLADFRRRNGFGRGIAAPQIGVLHQVLFIRVKKSLSLINPRIVWRSRKLVTLWDDCFSLPNIIVKVHRNLKIKVRYQDIQGAKHLLEADGELAELLQHEIDHLDGILAIDRAIDTKHIVLRSEYERHIGKKEGILF